LSDLELTLGEVAEAVRDAKQSVTYADRSGDAFQRMGKRSTHADALHQAGRRAEAEARFREAEQIQAEDQPEYPLLYSLQGFRYCDLLLDAPERAAWQQMQKSEVRGERSEFGEACRAVSERAKKMFEWRVPNDSLLTIALDHLTSGRAALYEAILDESEIRNPKSSRPWTVFVALVVAITSPAAFSPMLGCGFSPASAPAPTAHRPTWTRHGKSPSAGP
jgi:hypothetical protein